MLADAMDVLAEKLQIFRDEPVRVSLERMSVPPSSHDNSTAEQRSTNTEALAAVQETFLAVAGVAEGLVAHAALARGISPTGATVRHLEAVSNVLRGSAQRDRLYLSRLESGSRSRVIVCSVLFLDGVEPH